MKKLLPSCILLFAIYTHSSAQDFDVELQSSKIIISDVPTQISFILKNKETKNTQIDTTFYFSGISVIEENQIKELTHITFTQGIASFSSAATHTASLAGCLC